MDPYLQALPDFSNKAQRIIWPFTAVSTVIFFMRLVPRLPGNANRIALSWDDLIITLAWCMNIVRGAFLQKAISASRAVNITDLPGTIPLAAFWVIFVDTWAFISIATPKLAVGLILVRIFRPRRPAKITILTSVIVLNILCIVGFVITLVQCDPAAGQWNPFKYPNAHCWPRGVALIYASTVSGISAFLDIAFSVYPGFVIWHLQMPVWKRVSIMCLMGLGFASFAFAVIKLESNTLLLGNPSVFQLLYDGIRIGLWNSVENDFVLSAACLPGTPPFFRTCRTLASGYLSSNGSKGQLNTVNSWIAKRSRGPHRRKVDSLNTDDLLNTRDEDLTETTELGKIQSIASSDENRHI